MSGYGDMMAGLGQSRMTLEQWNYQKEMQRRSERKPAGVTCTCGVEMVYETFPPEWNVAPSEKNMSPFQSPNVLCPACGKFGRKL